MKKFTIKFDDAVSDEEVKEFVEHCKTTFKKGGKIISDAFKSIQFYTEDDEKEETEEEK
jgi:hypothetical protein